MVTKYEVGDIKFKDKLMVVKGSDRPLNHGLGTEWVTFYASSYDAGSRKKPEKNYDLLVGKIGAFTKDELVSVLSGAVEDDEVKKQIEKMRLKIADPDVSNNLDIYLPNPKNTNGIAVGPALQKILFKNDTTKIAVRDLYKDWPKELIFDLGGKIAPMSLRKALTAAEIETLKAAEETLERILFTDQKPAYYPQSTSDSLYGYSKADAIIVKKAFVEFGAAVKQLEEIAGTRMVFGIEALYKDHPELKAINIFTDSEKFSPTYKSYSDAKLYNNPINITDNLGQVHEYKETDKLLEESLGALFTKFREGIKAIAVSSGGNYSYAIELSKQSELINLLDGLKKELGDIPAFLNAQRGELGALQSALAEKNIGFQETRMTSQEEVLKDPKIADAIRKALVAQSILQALPYKEDGIKINIKDGEINFSSYSFEVGIIQGFLERTSVGSGPIILEDIKANKPEALVHHQVADIISYMDLSRKTVDLGKQVEASISHIMNMPSVPKNFKYFGWDSGKRMDDGYSDDGFRGGRNPKTTYWKEHEGKYEVRDARISDIYMGDKMQLYAGSLILGDLVEFYKGITGEKAATSLELKVVAEPKVREKGFTVGDQYLLEATFAGKPINTEFLDRLRHLELPGYEVAAENDKLQIKFNIEEDVILPAVRKAKEARFLNSDQLKNPDKDELEKTCSNLLEKSKKFEARAVTVDGFKEKLKEWKSGYNNISTQKTVAPATEKDIPVPETTMPPSAELATGTSDISAGLAALTQKFSGGLGRASSNKPKPSDKK